MVAIYFSVSLVSQLHSRTSKQLDGENGVACDEKKEKKL